MIATLRVGSRAAAAGILVALTAMTAGCAAEATVVTKSAAPAYESTYEQPAPTHIAPLRGTTVEAGSLDHAAVMAKIDNHWSARPQLGLSATDIVFEELVEGGITRYVAVWHSTVPEQFGPVRSIRPMDPDIAAPFGGIIFYAGGQPQFVSMMRNTPVYNAIHGQPDTADYMFRASDRTAPHNVIAEASKFLAAHSDIAAPTLQFAYAADAASSTAAKEGSPTQSLDLAFSTQFRPSWTWDAASSRFLRWQDGKPDTDASDGQQLAATNVVTLRVPVTMSAVPKTELIGSGEAWVSTGGGTVHATWSKASATAPITLMGDDGITVRLGAGNTWIELVPLAGSFSAVPPGA
ncbi:DUF3048 domain-containing protein [Homoserinimonas hongtaonis]|uniref:DUF3048 domain-containing protein n=1 Tax=Homoserinimonas hongtaonis TaxID=2079791 RepID=UPI00131EE789|nr:DUF3048 domain-containing protein [Salinibacterium hongtaonis]